MRTFSRFGALALGLSMVACGQADDMASPDLPAAFANHPVDAAMWEVRITNLTSGQPFTPPIIATHRGTRLMFNPGWPASHAIQEIAENGNLAPMMALLGGEKGVAEWTVVFGGTIPPVLPGEEVVTTIGSVPGARWLSLASMLICTNDGFTGVDAVALPRSGQSVTVYGDAYDAGTEINTEDFADIVPPCPALTGVPSTDPGTGTTNPALAENGVVHHHPGIQGGDDLDPAIHGWSNPVVKVVITRLN